MHFIATKKTYRGKDFFFCTYRGKDIKPLKCGTEIIASMWLLLRMARNQ
jgi:hypothetical protein